MDMGRAMVRREGMGIRAVWVWIVRCRLGRRDIDRRVSISLRRLLRAIRLSFLCGTSEKFCKDEASDELWYLDDKTGTTRLNEANEKKYTETRDETGGHLHLHTVRVAYCIARASCLLAIYDLKHLPSIYSLFYLSTISSILHSFLGYIDGWIGGYHGRRRILDGNWAWVVWDGMHGRIRITERLGVLGFSRNGWMDIRLSSISTQC